VGSLYDRPSARKVDLVDPKLLLPISVPNTGINVVVVEHRTKRRVVVDTLATGPVHPVVRLKDSRTSTLRASLASLVDETASCAGGSADLDLVFLALGWPVRVEAAALADREEQVMVFAIETDERSFLRMLAFRLEGDVGGCRAVDGLDGWILHVDDEEIVPERAEGHDKL